MYTKSEMRRMSNEELNAIAQEKNAKGIATEEAKYAQELIWERRFPGTERIEDDYTGLADINDEDFQEYLDVMEFWDVLR